MIDSQALKAPLYRYLGLGGLFRLVVFPRFRIEFYVGGTAGREGTAAFTTIIVNIRRHDAGGPMIRSTFLSSAVAVVLLGNPCAVATGQAAGAMQATSKQATPTEAAPFIGQWTLALQGPNSPGTFDLAVKVENDKVVGEIGSEQMPKQAINDVTADKDTLVLSYSFDYQGNAVDATVSLGPAKDGKVPAQISFAGGAYVMSGSATKKDPSK